MNNTNRIRCFFEGVRNGIRVVLNDLPTAQQVGFGSVFLGAIAALVIGAVAIVIAIIPPTTSSLGQLHWERYDGGYCDVWRTPTPDGWLVMCNGKPCYIPDPQHRWIFLTVTESERD